jgi:biopolymer transport protein TolR
MAFQTFREEGAPVSDINVTPLVDVMLVLLIIFMITTPLFERGIDVSLPQSATSNISGAERIILTIPKDKNYIYFNSQPVNRNLMKNYLEQIFSGRQDKTIYLFADKNVPYGDVMSIIDEVKLAGIETIGLATEPPSSK